MSTPLSHAPNRGALVRRALLTALVGLVYTAFCWHPEWMTLLGVSNLGVWFLDTRALLAASDAQALGVDPHGRNPLDLFLQPHVYSDWWFAFHSLGLDRDDHVWLGASLGGVFLLVALVQMRVRSTRELLWSFSLLCAPPIILGFNRGNADLLVFVVLSVAVPFLFSRRRYLNWLAILVVGFAAGLKYYPALAGLLWLTRVHSRRERVVDLAALILLLILVAIDQTPNAAQYVADKSEPRGFFAFGAGTLEQVTKGPWWTSLSMSFLVGAAGTLGALRWAPKWAIPQQMCSDYLRFVLGAVLIAGCYFATINYSYRCVFALWMAPFLWAGWTASGWPNYYRNLCRAAVVLLTAFLWMDGLLCLGINLLGPHGATEITRWTNTLVLAQQPLVALLIAALIALLVPFARDGLADLLRAHPAASNRKSD